MVRTLSSMYPLGTPAPYFALPDTVTGSTVRLDYFFGNGPLLVIFLANSCPYVRHVARQIRAIGDDYGDDLGIVGISSNDARTLPDDAPQEIAVFARSQGFTFPVLYDQSQDTAKAFHAACTPDFFLYDERLELVYRGRLDAARPGNGAPNDGADLRGAIHAVLLGQAPPLRQLPSVGCNVRWRNGNAPWQMPALADLLHRPTPGFAYGMRLR